MSRLNQHTNLLQKQPPNLVWVVDLVICQVKGMIWKVVVWEADLVIYQVEVMVLTCLGAARHPVCG